MCCSRRSGSGVLDAAAHLIERPARIAGNTSIGVRQLLERTIKLYRDLLRLFRDHGEGLCCLRNATCHKLLAYALAEFRGNSCRADTLGDFCWQLCQPCFELLTQSDCILPGGLNSLDAVA